jgi:predicted AlkP superfamily phosphohydrolase/phosphomutase
MDTLILGFDAFDPVVFERLAEAGRQPNLQRYLEAGNYRRFQVASPPQSEVSWTSIATGKDPGEHGIFDFVHRNPANYGLQVSLLPVKKSAVGTQFVPPHTAYTIFDHAIDRGYPARSVWWPATFPARPESPVEVMPGLGVPDIQGRLGVGTYFSPDREWQPGEKKSALGRLKSIGPNRFSGALEGPQQKSRDGVRPAELNFELESHADGATLTLGKTRLELTVGQWSPIVEIKFKLGLLVSVHALTRFILTQAGSDPRVYALPLQIHPLHSPWRYSAPPGFAKKTWKSAGPYLTLGWPQDTTALEEGLIDDAAFLRLCDQIFEQREQVFLHHLDSFNEGVFGTVFDTLDRVQHMFSRDRPDVVEQWYEKFDAFLGRVEVELAARRRSPNLIVVSDHGFAPFDHKIHLNRWLVEQGYLALEAGSAGSDLSAVDWSRSQAYAIGLNSLYLNLAGREGQGQVTPDQRNALVAELIGRLHQWQGPDGQPVVTQAQSNEQAFSGPFKDYGPDVVVGYGPGYRASSETGLGGWDEALLMPNHDHWGADHCMAADSLSGVIFAGRGLEDFEQVSFRDFPSLAVGDTIKSGSSAPPPIGGDDDQEVVAERLKGLGYL